MVIKPTPKERRGGPPPLDESWWASLLTEEESCYPLDSSDGPYNEPKKEARSIDVDWENARDLYSRDQTVNLLVTGYNRGGLLVEGDGLQGFVPLSHLLDLPMESCQEEEREEQLSEYAGKRLLLKIIECDAERGRVVFSERAAQSAPGRRTELLQTLRTGQRLCGSVTNITDFGVFVDLGGLEGLIHVSELSWGRVRHPADMLQLNQQVEVYVISVDQERARVALSIKRLFPNPWETVEMNYFPGQLTDAVITSILPFGAFARLEEGLDGLIHVSEMSGHGNKTVKPEDCLEEGQRVKVRILQVDAARQRLGLSLQLEPRE